MENNEISLTSLTDDEIKDFNTEVEHECFLPIRNGLKDALDVILLTVNYFDRHSPSDAGDDSVDSIYTGVSAAILKIDEMDTTELAKIAERDNYVYDAFKLVEEYIPKGVLDQADIQFVRSRNFPHEGYLRKVLDIVGILRIPAMRYMGSDVAYGTAICLKNRLAKYPGENDIFRVIPGESGYTVYTNKLSRNSHDSTYPTAMSTLRIWSDENLDDTTKDKFFAFLIRHESDISKYIQVKQQQNQVADFDYKGMCTFFYRWFLKEQQSYKE